MLIHQEILSALDWSHAKIGSFVFFFIIIWSCFIWLIPVWLSWQLSVFLLFDQRFPFWPCSIFNVFNGRLSFNWRCSISTWPRRWMSSLFTYTTHRHGAFQHRFKFNNSRRWKTLLLFQWTNIRDYPSPLAPCWGLLLIFSPSCQEGSGVCPHRF